MPDPLTPSGLARVGEVAAAHVGSEVVPGLVVLVARHDQVHVEALGSLSIGGPDGQWSRPPAFGDGGAGLVSTASDLLAFAQMLLRGGAPVLTADAVTAMTTDQLTPAQARSGQGFLFGRSWGFCQSVVVEGPRAGAFGWDGGLGTSWLVDPNRDLTIIVLTQRLFETAEAPAVHRDVQAAAYDAVA